METYPILHIKVYLHMFYQEFSYGWLSLVNGVVQRCYSIKITLVEIIANGVEYFHNIKMSIYNCLQYRKLLIDVYRIANR